MEKAVMPAIARATVIRTDRGKDSTATRDFSGRRHSRDVGARLQVDITGHYRRMLPSLIPRDLPAASLRASPKPQDGEARKRRFQPSCGVPGAVFELRPLTR